MECERGSVSPVVSIGIFAPDEIPGFGVEEIERDSGDEDQYSFRQAGE
jgi:hypothetical protein